MTVTMHHLTLQCTGHTLRSADLTGCSALSDDITFAGRLFNAMVTIDCLELRGTGHALSNENLTCSSALSDDIALTGRLLGTCSSDVQLAILADT